MGYKKNEMIKMEEAKLSHNVKKCDRCFNSISEEEYERNEGFCDSCKYQKEKTQKE
jgi:hypothetical protein